MIISVFVYFLCCPCNPMGCISLLPLPRVRFPCSPDLNCNSLRERFSVEHYFCFIKSYVSVANVPWIMNHIAHNFIFSIAFRYLFSQIFSIIMQSKDSNWLITYTQLLIKRSFSCYHSFLLPSEKCKWMNGTTGKSHEFFIVLPTATFQKFIFLDEKFNSYLKQLLKPAF